MFKDMVQGVDQEDIKGIIRMLYEEGYISEREFRLALDVLITYDLDKMVPEDKKRI